MRTGRREERRRQFALVAAAPTDVSEVDRAGAELEPTHILSFSLIGLSLIARLAMVAVAAVLLWSAVFWALA